MSMFSLKCDRDKTRAQLGIFNLLHPFTFTLIFKHLKSLWEIFHLFISYLSCRVDYVLQGLDMRDLIVTLRDKKHSVGRPSMHHPEALSCNIM